ncbi:hypothetical protein [Afipia clevelandensis]|uniref:hypothetical protein n=1 Tax=Afipia clevelandensis TaxID=1034 RepID=UPI0012F6EF3B|nr:hypothetical protein [Afipia clevelandensis]
MTVNAISFQDLLIGRRCEPLTRGFQNILDVSRHVAERTDQFNLRNQNAALSGVLHLHQGDVEVAVADKHVSDGLEVDQWNVVAVDNSFLAHNVAPQPKAATLDHFQNGIGGKEIRFRIAPLAFNSKAADGRGIPPAASVHHDVGQRRNLVQRNPRKNHLNPKYVSAISTAAAPAIQHHIENSFSFSPRSKCSSKSRLLTSALTVVATNSVAPHSRANAGHRGSV